MDLSFPGDGGARPRPDNQANQSDRHPAGPHATIKLRIHTHAKKNRKLFPHRRECARLRKTINGAPNPLPLTNTIRGTRLCGPVRRGYRTHVLFASLGIHPDRHGSVIDQADLHVRAEFSGSDRLAEFLA